MATIFCIRPATPNIGNDLIHFATASLLENAFGSGCSIVNVPALANGTFGGLSRSQVYDINRLADGVVMAAVTSSRTVN